MKFRIAASHCTNSLSFDLAVCVMLARAVSNSESSSCSFYSAMFLIRAAFCPNLMADMLSA